MGWGKMRGVQSFLSVALTLGLITCGAPGAMLDGDAAAEISGTVSFSQPLWDADVEYAVYAPGNYPGTHADKAASHIYAYQVFNASASSVMLSSLSVGVDPGSGAASATDDTFYGAAAGVAPLLSRLVGSPATSAQWTIAPAPGAHTTVLLFSSPNHYTFAPATVVDGGQGDTHDLPTPVPEPATLSLLAVAGALLGFRRRRRR